MGVEVREVEVKLCILYTITQGKWKEGSLGDGEKSGWRWEVYFNVNHWSFCSIIAPSPMNYIFSLIRFVLCPNNLLQLWDRECKTGLGRLMYFEVNFQCNWFSTLSSNSNAKKKKTIHSSIVGTWLKFFTVTVTVIKAKYLTLELII